MLRLADLEQSKNAVLHSLGAASSQESYGHTIDEFIGWYCSEPRLSFNRTVVLRYRFFLEQKNLAPSTINVRLAAVRRLAYEASDTGLLSPDLAAGIRRVKGAKRLGVRIGNWLTIDQSRTLLCKPSDSLRGKRDRAILALLIGCGLRRAELVGLRTGDFQVREENWVIADLVGRGKHIRTVPVPLWAKRAVDEWIGAAAITDGTIFRRVSRLDKIWGDGITPKGNLARCKTAAKRADIKKLAPHDLPRTCARLCHLAGGELEQIQFLLGHASVQTTERYLGSKQRLSQAGTTNSGWKTPDGVVMAPNPTSGQLNVSWPKTTGQSSVRLRIHIARHSGTTSERDGRATIVGNYRGCARYYLIHAR
jgi:integrase